MLKAAKQGVTEETLLVVEGVVNEEVKGNKTKVSCSIYGELVSDPGLMGGHQHRSRQLRG